MSAGSTVGPLPALTPARTGLATKCKHLGSGVLGRTRWLLRPHFPRQLLPPSRDDEARTSIGQPKALPPQRRPRPKKTVLAPRRLRCLAVASPRARLDIPTPAPRLGQTRHTLNSRFQATRQVTCGADPRQQSQPRTAPTRPRTAVRPRKPPHEAASPWTRRGRETTPSWSHEASLSPPPPCSTPRQLCKYVSRQPAFGARRTPAFPAPP